MEQFVRTFFGYHSDEMSFNLNNAEIYLQLVAIDGFVFFSIDGFVFFSFEFVALQCILQSLSELI